MDNSGVPTIQNRLRLILSDEMKADVVSLKLRSLMKDDLGLDSLDMAELIMYVNEHFSIHITDEDIRHIVKFDDLVAMVERQVADGQ